MMPSPTLGIVLSQKDPVVHLRYGRHPEDWGLGVLVMQISSPASNISVARHVCDTVKIRSKLPWSAVIDLGSKNELLTSLWSSQMVAVAVMLPKLCCA
jgi:hypothetical protein